MRIYLVRHGEAKSKEEDPERHLTERGREEARRIASFLSRVGIGVEEVLHSGKTRARETAEIIATELGIRVREVDGLDPLADPSEWAERLREMEGDVILVGHLPHLSRLAGLLLTGSPSEFVKMSSGGALCLEREENGWFLIWLVSPTILA